MTEFSTFPEIIEPVISENGHNEAAASEPAALVSTARIDAARKMFITSRGNEIELSGQRISSLMVERFAKISKPVVPLKVVTLLGKHQQLEANPNDPGYLTLLKEWNSEQNIANLVYLFNVGIKGQPPSEFVEEQTEFFPEADRKTMKYLWVASQLPDEDINTLSEAILGQSLPTEKGLAQSADSFRRQD